MNKIFKKTLLFVGLIPFIAKASICDNSNSIINNYFKSPTFSSTYMNYFSENSGELLSLEEFNIIKNGNKNDAHSYLFDGYSFCGKNNKLIPNNNIYNPKIRIVETVKPEIMVSGAGTFNNPWVFNPIVEETPNTPVDTSVTIILDSNDGFFGERTGTISSPFQSEYVLQALVEVPVVMSSQLNLSSNQKYLLEFDYKSIGGNVTFNTDLYPDELPEIMVDATPTLRRKSWIFESPFPSISSSIVRFFNDRYHPNPYEVDISNISLSTCTNCTQNKTITRSYNGTYGNLDTPNKTGYVFLGWYTSPTGGTKITSTTRITSKAERTLYAHWGIDSPLFSYTGSYSTKEEPVWQYELLTDGVLTVSQNVNVDIFCVGGGGGGGSSIYYQAVGGGGGAGGYTSTITTTLNAGKQYNVTIGAGGTGGIGAQSVGHNGSDGGNTSIVTTQDGTIISAQGGQGGGGAYHNTSGSCTKGCAGNGGSGGSGGGGSGKNYSSANKGGDGGTNGENGQSGGSPTYTNVGNYIDLGRAYSTGSGIPGYGGLGQMTTTCAFGESNGSECVSGYDAFAGGGGGGSGYHDKNYGLGGKANANLYIGGRGGSKIYYNTTPPTNGTTNTGSGGGGGVFCASGKYTAAGCIGADGGSGICIIRFH